jgi:hypothetical protein
MCLKLNFKISPFQAVLRIRIILKDLFFTFLVKINAVNIVEINVIQIFASRSSFVEQILAKKCQEKLLKKFHFNKVKIRSQIRTFWKVCPQSGSSKFTNLWTKYPTK